MEVINVASGDYVLVDCGLGTESYIKLGAPAVDVVLGQIQDSETTDTTSS